jgi:GNAT superfamily N-acetyltransferase
MTTFPDTLITWYLEMTDPAGAQPAPATLEIRPMTRPDIPFYLFLYKEVGWNWRWRDRLLMPPEKLRAAISGPGVRVNVLYVEGVPAGYVELAQAGASTEVAYFGLREAFGGQGYGKGLLTYGIISAWAIPGTERVWVHTCNLDSPAALPLYQKCGFRIYDEIREPMPERYTV